jgi:hypothetical protein
MDHAPKPSLDPTRLPQPPAPAPAIPPFSRDDFAPQSPAGESTHKPEFVREETAYRVGHAATQAAAGSESYPPEGETVRPAAQYDQEQPRGTEPAPGSKPQLPSLEKPAAPVVDPVGNVPPTPSNNPIEPVERGEYLHPGDPDSGFKVTRLNQEFPKEPISVQEAFPLSYMGGDHAAKERLAATTMEDKLMNGEMQLRAVEHTNNVPLQNVSLVLDIPIKTSAYERAVADDRTAPDLFDAENKAMGYAPNASALEDLIDPVQKRALIQDAIAAATTNRSARARNSFVNELSDLNSVQIAAVKGVTQAYDLTDGNRSVRLLNLSSTPMNEEHVRQTVNAVRAAADKSGGGVYDRLHVIAVLPEDHPMMRVKVQREDGRQGTVARVGLQEGNSILLSDRLIKNPEAKLPMPELGRDKTLFERFGLPGETEKGPNSPRKTVIGEDLQGNLAHELEHAALPMSYHAELPGHAPSLYGRTNTDEHVAEIGAAMYRGGEYAAEVPVAQRFATQEMWGNYRGTDDGVTYRQPLGPHFVNGTELDVRHGPLPLRVRDGAQEVPAEITYHLVPD